MRKLASVCTISETFPLEGKDRVHGIRMEENAYEAMVSKDIQKGDLVVFIQEGALLPETETWEFLRNLKCYKESEKAFLIGVKKFKTIKSWGLVLKLTEVGLSESEIKKLKAGDDLTDILKIRKYEPQEDTASKESRKPKWVTFCMSHSLTRWIGKIYFKINKKVPATFPSEFISKSDETTIQNDKSVIEKFADTRCYATAKMEGQSFTALIHPISKKFMICSRNSAYTKPNNTDFWKGVKNTGIDQKLKDYVNKTGKYLIIQGEQCGPGIQSNIYHFKNIEWFVFAIKEYDPMTKDCVQLSWEQIATKCKELDLRTVPFLGYFVLGEVMPDIDSAVKYAEQKGWGYADNNYDFNKSEGKIWKNWIQHEGVVIRSLDYDKSKNIGFSVKIKNIDYAEKKLPDIAKCAEAIISSGGVNA